RISDTFEQKGHKRMLHGKKVVGIVPTAPVFGKTEKRYDDAYKFCDTYCVRAYEAGMIPLGVLPVDERIRTDILDICDAFLIQGGATVRPYHVDVIAHAEKTGKKVLGICLGHQAIQGYFATKHEAEKRGWTGSLGDLYAKLLKEDDFTFLGKVEGHRLTDGLIRGRIDEAKHRVTFSEDSRVARIFGTTQVMGVSLHIYDVKEPAPGLVVTGWSDDGTVEAVEAGDRIIGTQFHPDADDKLPRIFDWLAD
ncbi:MAG: gamma-glutamyl-gamma-aminobutyrate hydrolase family protein, partial [Clostridia bacterium]|nr:gamma-glutamyl-gamma-aminobutyrate hydrolase family protein [Clostridia bacterium]